MANNHKTTSLPANAADLKDLMLSNSPNLSDRVVQDLVRENTILQNSDLLSIIAANPDVAHNEELLRMLRDKTNPMDEWMIDFLRDMGTYQTNRTLLEQTFAQKQYEREEIAWQMVRYLLNDSIADSLHNAELRIWLNIINTPRAKYMSADTYLAEGNATAALALVNNIDNTKLDRYEILEHEGMKTWYLLQEQLQQINKNIYLLDSAQLAVLIPLANQERVYGLAGTLAANVLNHYRPNSYSLPTLYPEDNSNARTSNDAEPKQKRTIKKHQSIDAEYKSLAIKVYPNPSSGIINIELAENDKISLINLIDTKGNLVLSQNTLAKNLISINTEKLANGNYELLFLNENKKVVKSEKIMISK